MEISLGMSHKPFRIKAPPLTGIISPPKPPPHYERFISDSLRYSIFFWLSLSSKTNMSKFSFDLESVFLVGDS